MMGFKFHHILIFTLQSAVECPSYSRQWGLALMFHGRRNQISRGGTSEWQNELLFRPKHGCPLGPCRCYIRHIIKYAKYHCALGRGKEIEGDGKKSFVQWNRVQLNYSGLLLWLWLIIIVAAFLVVTVLLLLFVYDQGQGFYNSITETPVSAICFVSMKIAVDWALHLALSAKGVYYVHHIGWPIDWLIGWQYHTKLNVSNGTFMV